jgi:ribosomal protein S6
MKLVNRFNQIIKSLTWKIKKDRHGAYKAYTFKVNKGDAEIIKNWAKTNL